MQAIAWQRLSNTVLSKGKSMQNNVKQRQSEAWQDRAAAKHGLDMRRCMTMSKESKDAIETCLMALGVFALLVAICAKVGGQPI